MPLIEPLLSKMNTISVKPFLIINAPLFLMTSFYQKQGAGGRLSCDISRLIAEIFVHAGKHGVESPAVTVHGYIKFSPPP